MVGENDWLVVGDLLVGVGHQDPASAGLYVGLRVVVTLTQRPLTWLLHSQSPQLAVILDQPLGHLGTFCNCAKYFNSSSNLLKLKVKTKYKS